MSTFDAAALDAHIRERMKKQEIPGLSITFSDESGILFDKAYGHIDGDRKKPVTEDTIMGIASMSKSMTGVCLALLEYEGKLSIDDKVTKFFPGFKIPGTPKDAVLVHHLLMHTAGLPPLPTLAHSLEANTLKDPGETRELEKLPRLIKANTTEEIIDYIREGDYRTLGQPGEYMSYSNDGYAILSSIVDMAAGKPMEEYIEEKLFAPLGMTRSALGYHRLKDFDNVTQVFSKRDDKLVTASDNWSLAPPYRGCGWVISSSRDMHRYYKMLSQNGVFEGKRILPESVAERMLGLQFQVVKRGVYGYGLNKVPCRGEVLFTHTGGLKGVSSAGAFFKDKGVAGAVLTNLGGVDALRILAGAFNVLQGKKPDAFIHNFTLSPTPPQEPWIYEGYYGNAESGQPPFAEAIKVVLENDRLTATYISGEKHILSYCGENLFMSAKEGDDPLREGSTMRFYVKDDKAWAVQSGSRMTQRL